MISLYIVLYSKLPLSNPHSTQMTSKHMKVLIWQITNWRVQLRQLTVEFDSNGLLKWLTVREQQKVKEMEKRELYLTDGMKACLSLVVDVTAVALEGSHSVMLVR